MATNPIGGSPSPVIIPNLFSTFDRNTIASAVEVLVAVLDAMDGDTDVEPNGDEEDSDGDERGDPAYLEWHTRGSHKMDRHGAERLARDLHSHILHEDAEDDDPAEDDDHSGQRDEDECNTGGDPGLWLGDCDLEPARVPPQWPAPVAND